MSDFSAILYTVRDFIGTADGLKETLSKLSQLGFSRVELCGIDFSRNAPEEIKEWCAGHHLSISSMHGSPEEVLKTPEMLAQRARALGGVDVIYPFPAGVDLTRKREVLAWLAALEASRREMESAGIILAYHHHGHEFQKVDGVPIMELLLKETGLALEADTHWIHYGGVDPVAFINGLEKKRLRHLHLKDYILIQNQRHFAPVGEGNLNFPGILEAAAKAGCTDWIVEQDECYGRDPFECLAASLEYLSGLTKPPALPNLLS